MAEMPADDQHGDEKVHKKETGYKKKKERSYLNPGL
jgi:hypothetical protein